MEKVQLWGGKGMIKKKKKHHNVRRKESQERGNPPKTVKRGNSPPLSRKRSAETICQGKRGKAYHPPKSVSWKESNGANSGNVAKNKRRKKKKGKLGTKRSKSRTGPCLKLPR